MMLAEKYRPTTFDEVIGQDKVIAAMRWHLDRESESGSAFLLTGPSGSGKTTLAECAAGHWDVARYDYWRIESAECTVERLRELANDLYQYGAGPLGRKLYVLDEIHTVTERAMDRLLSLLESLPRHVLLVGTTTETDWTDGVLLSRFTRFDLSKVRAADVAAHLERIATKEGLPIPADKAWAAKLVKYGGVNIRDQLNQLPNRLFGAEAQAA